MNFIEADLTVLRSGNIYCVRGDQFCVKGHYEVKDDRRYLLLCFYCSQNW